MEPDTSSEDFEIEDELVTPGCLGGAGKSARYTIEAAQHGQPEDLRKAVS